MSETWEIFDRIGTASSTSDGSLDPKADAWMSAVAERLADKLPSLSQASLRAGAIAARNAYDRIDRTYSMDLNSPTFIGGRLAFAADLLGYASSRSAHDQAASLARRTPYAQVLSELSLGALRNVDLGEKLIKTEAQICRILKELRDFGLVASQRRGREVFNLLTPIGRLIVEDGIQAMRRVPLSETNVIDFSANKMVVLANLEPVSRVSGSALPRLRTHA